MRKSSTKAIFDALTGSSLDSCDPDWCAGVLASARSEDIERVKKTLSKATTEAEAASILRVMPWTRIIFLLQK